MSAFLFGVPGKLKTLLDRLTSGRAAALDNLDAAISSRAAASTALSSATWTSTRAGYLDNIGIKSIQTGTINVSITTYESSNTATITSVNTAKSVCLFNGSSGGNNSDTARNARVALTNATTVTATASHTPSGTGLFTVGYTVVEFN